MFGSCFASCIAERLLRLRFQAVVNPFGISYNPISIANQLNRLSENRLYTSSDLQLNDGLYFSRDHHGSFSASTAEQTLNNINSTFQTAADSLPHATHIIITLGSSVVYQKDGIVWNNCHKLPQRHFSKRQLTVSEVVNPLYPLLNKFHDKRFIFTVSPVRYLHDNNSVNKATLVLALDRLCSLCPNALYFPAYEILMDELRDYRFYADDMIHPSALAEQIIFDRFSETFFTKAARELNIDIEKLASMQGHRPLHPDSPEYERFKLKLSQYEKNVNDALARSRCAVDDCSIHQ